MVRPPFRITPAILLACSEIERLVGRCEGAGGARPEPRLRYRNRIRTIQATAAIEGNTLTLEQVTAILDNKRVIGPARDIAEIKNAIAAYDGAPKWNPLAPGDLLAAHGVLMKGLLPDAGRWRGKDVGIFHGDKVAHIAPPAARVPALMKGLFEFMRREKSLSNLIKACVFHYEVEFIHPFTDGNGRTGRLWQHVALLRSSPVFTYIPTETVIKDRQKAYHAALAASDMAGESTTFVEFSLGTIRDSLAEFLGAFRPETSDARSRLDAAAAHFDGRAFSRKDYLALQKTISTATASRDLRDGVKDRRLEMSGTKATTRYRFWGVVRA